MKGKISEFRAKSISELEREIQELRKDIAKLRLEVKVNPPKDSNMMMKKRKQLAILSTILGEKREIEKLKQNSKED
ncbi:50S ribosomal protein L29 [Candidatus Roizmanbacteria bacterium RIFCSPHIGHO2_02_FULL_37_15]|uniref:Large ribosomal subunit protein uL29 n=1 Tax=Candidatus Roizmanbacteria bacterium RIFCSPLOWO2_01_FULL_37_16 TaxID=1802058 RepID=A0A1F7IPK2_9BACT|nr:MAG: 50S ribosomal protein L29 [Candidatus Roizmanbacteria bacterium RIFCSPHIGHO2_01_FULL_37_16b]OGK21767.1 MAG: 50S ribosomal protein L29 [Candidatus Roizmanbacteria bacterium RIFCSPHIGHO2_02_FULL_37_15]OGK33708.1 MAG: 50S ribosomal protein L29 [Candidatus Roizmanbacteria bacterium RIFCSPHIGHO2_12_FULL_36_11]OGK45212.1 MAG: 50S ribosomal protein L29 [Candidatus Roizmanbacteria bacterium RIFCSPLOWO2_01_FULL_37_16]